MEEPRTEDMLALMARLQRLRRLTQSAGEGKEVPQETPLPFAEEKGERILMTAIPFLDWAYQKDLYVIVRLMEMRRMLSGGLLQARSKEAVPPALRRRQMLSAIRPCLSAEEQRQLDTVLKVMDATSILEGKDIYHGGNLEKTGSTGIGRGTHSPVAGSAERK